MSPESASLNLVIAVVAIFGAAAWLNTTLKEGLAMRMIDYGDPHGRELSISAR